MISRKQFDDYNKAVGNLSNGAAREVESQIWAWLQTDEGKAASVAECREYAKDVMNGVIQVYDDAAATLAADWYDSRASTSGKKLESAITATTYNPKTVDETARYQAKKLVKGDTRGFAKYCGELASNDVLRSLNETIIANAGRDKDKGVRFARVLTGAETCTFCVMLASRGAVYHSRKTAGEFKHFHRRCDCKVVPGFDDDRDAILVEGIDPKELREQWRAFERIDGFSISAESKNRLKADWIKLMESGSDDAEWWELVERRTVDIAYIKSKMYRSRLSDALNGESVDLIHDDIIRMLSHRSKTDYEDLYAYDLDSGVRLGSVVNSKDHKSVSPTRKVSDAIAAAVGDGGRVVIVHNHPDSFMPSASDIASIQRTGSAYGLTVCHDGSIYRFSLVDKRYEGYNNDDWLYVRNQIVKGYERRLASGKTEKQALLAASLDWGVEIELIR